MRMAKTASLCTGDILDVGCGGELLRGYLSSGYYVGLDIEGGTVRGSAVELPFRNRSFDTVALCEVLEHLESPHMALREACRVARKRLVISIPNEYSLVRLARLAAGIPMEPEPLHAIDLNASHIERALIQQGFLITASFAFPLRLQLLPVLPLRSRFGYWLIMTAERSQKE
jgi:ubiquinone/menaquinone biosynthesis C-methylase UbiE